MTSGTPTTISTSTPAATPAGRLAEGTGQGRTTIAPSVVQKIAGIAAREVSGVYAMGSGASRAFGALRERIPGGGTSGASTVAGVAVEVGEKQAAIDLDVVVEYGVAIADLAAAVRRNVIGAVERMTGLEVIEVTISVNDIHLAGEDDSRDEAPAAPAPTGRVVE